MGMNAKLHRNNYTYLGQTRLLSVRPDTSNSTDPRSGAGKEGTSQERRTQGSSPQQGQAPRGRGRRHPQGLHQSRTVGAGHPLPCHDLQFPIVTNPAVPFRALLSLRCPATTHLVATRPAAVVPFSLTTRRASVATQGAVAPAPSHDTQRPVATGQFRPSEPCGDRSRGCRPPPSRRFPDHPRRSRPSSHLSSPSAASRAPPSRPTASSASAGARQNRPGWKQRRRLTPLRKRSRLETPPLRHRSASDPQHRLSVPGVPGPVPPPPPPGDTPPHTPSATCPLTAPPWVCGTGALPPPGPALPEPLRRERDVEGRGTNLGRGGSPVLLPPPPPP